MARYIDADALMKVIKSVPFPNALTIGAVETAVDLAPTADAVEVVRCKDCKWYKEGYDIDGEWFSRCNGSVRTYGQTKPDWFCADGERRE